MFTNYLELYVSIPSAHTREALNKSARAGSERFCSQARFGKRRNTACISRFSNRRLGAKDPLSSRRRFIQSFPRSEVRKHERGRKKAPFLGSGRPKAAGDSVRPAGKPDSKPIAWDIAAHDRQKNNGAENRLRYLYAFFRLSRWRASERSTRCSTRDGQSWAGRAPWPRRRSGRRLR